MKKILFSAALLLILAPTIQISAQCTPQITTNDPRTDLQKTHLIMSYDSDDTANVSTSTLLYKIVKGGGKRAFYMTPWQEGAQYVSSYSCEAHTGQVTIELSSLKSNYQAFWQAKKVAGSSVSYGELKSYTSKGRTNQRIEEGMNTDFSVYPNPANSQFSVPNQSGEVINFSLYDLTGKEVMSHAILNEMQVLNCNHIANGLYFYKIKFKDESTSSGKLIICH